MARKKNKEGKTLHEASLQKIKSAFNDQLMLMSRSSIASDVRSRIMDVNYITLRAIARRLSIVSMCINCREQQIHPFLEPAKELGAPGFVIAKKGEVGKRVLGKSNDKRADELTEFIFQTGFEYDSNREDDFVDFGKMLIREVLTIDQVAVELQRNRRGEVAAYWFVDGATVSRAVDTGYQGNKNISFVQELEGKVVATYTNEDMVFDYMFKRADLKYRGFGYSLLEQGVDLVTTLISGISYNRDLFLRDKIPKGFIALQGEADQETVEAVSRYWYAAMQGAGAQFSIPVLPSGKDGVGLEFKQLGQSNRDMEYTKLMMFFLSLFAGVFGIDLAELGIRTDTAQPLIGENVSGRQEHSRDRALRSLLAFLRTIMTKILRKVDKDYEFAFVGIDPEDEAKKYETQNKAISSSRTVNEVRERDGLESLEGEEYDTVLNPQLIQLKQILAGQQQQQGGEPGMPGEEGTEAGGEEQQPGEEQPPEEDQDIGEDEGEWMVDMKDAEEEQPAVKSLQNHLDQLRKEGYTIDIEV